MLYAANSCVRQSAVEFALELIIFSLRCSMEPVILNEQEQRIYADLFCRCDAGNSGKVTGIKATELFVCSGLPPETLHQVSAPFCVS